MTAVNQTSAATWALRYGMSKEIARVVYRRSEDFDERVRLSAAPSEDELWALVMEAFNSTDLDELHWGRKTFRRQELKTLSADEGLRRIEAMMAEDPAGGETEAPHVPDGSPEQVPCPPLRGDPVPPYGGPARARFLDRLTLKIKGRGEIVLNRVISVDQEFSFDKILTVGGVEFLPRGAAVALTVQDVDLSGFDL